MVKKCGYVTLIGKPNAGKSTLMNSLIKFDLSIVNKKVQTTRNKILGILTEDNYQIVFQDTPGIIEPKYELQKFMVAQIKSSFNEADLVLFLIDASDFKLDEITQTHKIFQKELSKTPKIAVVNKADTQNGDKMIEIVNQLKTCFKFDEIVPVSALKGFNLEELKKSIVKYLPASEFLFDEETITDKPEKFFVAEIIRRKALELYEEEIPYSVFVDIREFIERENSKDFINADIVLERESQKIILIGKNGSMLKKLGQNARAEIEKFLSREIFLQLFVKVRKDWRKDKEFLKSNFL